MEAERKRENCTSAVGQINKCKKYELKQHTSFQWKWIQPHPSVQVNIVKKETAQPLEITVPYLNAQPERTAVQSMYCGVCTKQPKITSKDSDFTKRSGTNNFKIEALKKHEASQNHKR